MDLGKIYSNKRKEKLGAKSGYITICSIRAILWAIITLAFSDVYFLTYNMYHKNIVRKTGQKTNCYHYYAYYKQ